MNVCVPIGKCSVCGKENVQVLRKYYYYDIDCKCCVHKSDGKKRHFSIAYYCENCKPKEPETTTITLKVKTKELKNGNISLAGEAKE